MSQLTIFQSCQDVASEFVGCLPDPRFNVYSGAEAPSSPSISQASFGGGHANVDINNN